MKTRKVKGPQIITVNVGVTAGIYQLLSSFLLSYILAIVVSGAKPFVGNVNEAQNLFLHPDENSQPQQSNNHEEPETKGTVLSWLDQSIECQMLSSQNSWRLLRLPSGHLLYSALLEVSLIQTRKISTTMRMCFLLIGFHQSSTKERKTTADRKKEV